MTLCEGGRKYSNSSLYQHKQIHANQTLVVDWGHVSATQVAALNARLNLLQLIFSQLLLSLAPFCECFKDVWLDIPEIFKNMSVALHDVCKYDVTQ